MVIAEGVITVFGDRRLYRTLGIGVSAACVATVLTTAGVGVASARPAVGKAPVMSHSLELQFAAIAAEKQSRTPAQRKIDSQLLWAEKYARHAAFPTHFPKLQLPIATDVSGDVLVEVHGSSTPALLADIAAADGQLVVSASTAGALRVRLPLLNLDELAAHPDVASITQPEQPQLATGGTVSEGDVTHRADLVRSDFGVNGTGVKIGVLSDGVKSLAASQAIGELGPVTVLPGQSGPVNGDEGTAMLEIVHDVAPGAQLFFATAYDTEQQFAQNIRSLRDTYHCDIIIDDVYYFHEPAFQDGPAAEAPVAAAVAYVTGNGALYFSSAGNSGNLDDGTSGVWEHDANSLVPGTVGSTSYDFVDFDSTGAIQVQNPMAALNSSHRATLEWSDRYAHSSNDYDLFVLSTDGSSVIAGSTNYQTGTQDPYEGTAVPVGPAGMRILIGLYDGNPRYLHLNLNRGRFAPYDSLAAFATAGMTSGHAGVAAAFGVAATPAHLAFNVGQPVGPYPGPFSASNVTETFSSDGPRRMFYDVNGTAYTPSNLSSTGGVVRQKPDITAADGVATSIAPDFAPFYGTSAAAPHAGAIAALLLDAHPGMTPAMVRTALTSTAIDIEAPGADRDSGAGIIDAYRAVQYMAPSALSISAPASVNYNANASVATKLTDATTHAGLRGLRVNLYRRANATRPWALVRTVTTSLTGTASTLVRMTANAQFLWRFLGNATYRPSTSAIRTVTARQLVTITKTASSIRHGRVVRFYGVVKPTGAGQRIYLQQRVRGVWRTKLSAIIHRQVMPNDRPAIGYLFAIKLPVRGSFLFRVYKPATATLAAGYSASTWVKVT